MRKIFLLAIAAFLVLPAPALAALPAATPGRELWGWNDAMPSLDRSVGSVARGSDGLVASDLGADGTAELLVGSGVGALPTIRVLRADGSQIFEFAAFGEDARSGVRLAAGDIDGDAMVEIVAATGAGPSGRVRVFDGHGTPDGDGFLPYGEGFRGGLAVTVGDFNGDGTSEIATMPSSGGGPHVKIIKKSGRVIGEFAAFFTLPVGDYGLAAGDLDGDGLDELMALRVESGRPMVRVMSAVSGLPLREFAVGAADVAATVATGDTDGDGRDEILIVSGTHPRLYVYDGDGKLLAETGVLTGFQGGARAAVGSFGTAGRLVAVATIESAAGVRPESPKFIEVDISEQRLRAYEYGRLVRSTLVATGMISTPTPIGEFSVTAKPYLVHYAWFYGSDSPRNYDLGWVPWNLRFQPHIYLHYAPWRKVFGVRGSHGCVNLSKTDAEWIFGWAEVGTPVTVKE